MSRPFEGRSQTFFSERSLGFYLIHYPVGIFVGAMLLGLPQGGTLPDVLLWLGVVLAVSLAYAEVSLRLVERPARRWAKRVTPRLRRPEPAPAPVPASPPSGVRA